MKRCVMVGCGGHARVLVDMLAAQGGVLVVGALGAQGTCAGGDVDGVPILGDDSLLDAMRSDGVAHAVIGVGSLGETQARRALVDRVVAAGFTVLGVVHPSAVVSPAASVADDVQIMARAVVQPGVSIASHAIINTAAVVEHDCRVGSFCHVSPGAVLCGHVTVEDDAHIGAGSTVIQRLRVGKAAIVGAGAVVCRNVEPGSVVVGVPAQPLVRRTVS